MNPSVSLLCKLGSIAVHVEELLSADGHEFDRIELDALLRDPEVLEWMKAMDAAAMLPKKRNG
jgi:hypothetical protein